MDDLTLALPPLVPVADAEDKPAPPTIEGEVREIVPPPPPRDGVYTFTARRRIRVVANTW